MGKSRDLFDDSTMSFGEHLEVLRIHLWKALIGLFVCVIGSLFVGDRVIDIVRKPIDDALREQNEIDAIDDTGEVTLSTIWEQLKQSFSEQPASAPDEEPPPAPEPELSPNEIRIEVSAAELAAALNRSIKPSAAAKEFEFSPGEPEGSIELVIAAPEFQQLERVVEDQNRAVTLTVQEAFMTYLKVSFITGLVIASPWVIYQLWLFVAAGLYPHERKYVYIFLPISIGLFFTGACFCFFAVFPFILNFLLGFNKILHVVPQIRLSEWISFAVLLPVMFGISFQLPLVMLFLERISVFSVTDYREKRKMAVLAISIISMFLTPADPMSMLMMMFPLLFLYELGILMCAMSPTQTAFTEEFE